MNFKKFTKSLFISNKLRYHFLGYHSNIPINNIMNIKEYFSKMKNYRI